MPIQWDKYKSNVWKAATVGDSIAGRVADIDVRKGQGGTDVPVVTLQLEDGSYREVWASPVDLRTKLADCAPKEGEYLSVEFIGEVHTGQPSPMKQFRVDLSDDAF